MLCGKSCTITVVEWDRDDVLVFVSSAVQFSVFPRLKQLVQISVFSTTVAIFLVETYKSLPPDSNNAIITSLSQIAHELVSLPFKPRAAAIKVNVTWLLSLVLSLIRPLSIAYSLSGFAQYLGARHNYPCTLHGVERSRPLHVVDSTPTLLHLSISLFIAGLIDFLLQY